MTACNENIKRHLRVTTNNECRYLYPQCKLLMPTSSSCVLKQEKHELLGDSTCSLIHTTPKIFHSVEFLTHFLAVFSLLATQAKEPIIWPILKEQKKRWVSLKFHKSLQSQWVALWLPNAIYVRKEPRSLASSQA